MGRITDSKHPNLLILYPQEKIAIIFGKEGNPLHGNKLARWALTLSQYDYSIEHRRTSEHTG